MLNKINFIANKTRKLCLTAAVFVIFPHVCFAPPPEDEGRPRQHICPITQEVMIDPVVAADGFSYERTAILKWFESSSKSPLTRACLEDKNLRDNVTLKQIIAEWKLGKRLLSVLESRTGSDVVQRVRSHFENNTTLLHSAKDKDIVVFLGGKGAGKSTLVNLLAKKRIIETPDEDAYVLADPNDPTALPIRRSGQSEICFPKFIDIDREGAPLRLFEFPAFNDTDDSEDNLVSAAFMRHILLEAKSVRCVSVAGQDQFTTDGGASVNKMFHSLKQFFVVEGQEKDLVNEGVFVVTKVTSKEQTDLIHFLQSKTDLSDKEELHTQLQSWARHNKLHHILHPMKKGDLASVGDKLLNFIKMTTPTKVREINRSVLYPPETVTPLERMFEHVMHETFDRRLRMPVRTPSEYDANLADYEDPSFWKRFDTIVCSTDKAISLLKEFCINQYTRILGAFVRENTQNLQDHVQRLKAERQEKFAPLEEEYASASSATGAVVSHPNVLCSVP